jgi:hypothetical protein
MRLRGGGEVVEVGRVRFFRVGVFLLAIILIVSARGRRHSRDLFDRSQTEPNRSEEPISPLNFLMRKIRNKPAQICSSSSLELAPGRLVRCFRAGDDGGCLFVSTACLYELVFSLSVPCPCPCFKQSGYLYNF